MANQTCDEDITKHHLGNVILLHLQISRTNVHENFNQLVRRITIRSDTYMSLVVSDGKLLIFVQSEDTSIWISSKSYFVGTTLPCNGILFLREVFD